MATSEPCRKCGAETSTDGVCPACMLDRGWMQESDSLHSGNIPLPSFGDYEILGEIARGGMGVVYKARQKSLNRFVAIKMVLAGRLARKSDLQRFRVEAETAARLQHPNIVAIHEVGEFEGQPFFSMDYVEGKSLAELAHNEPLPAKHAAAYLKTIAEAVEYAHSKGVLHRDLKPSNILIDQNDQPRITDFGLAKRIVGDDVRRLTSNSDGDRLGEDQNLLTSSPAELTITGQVLGSPNFMPPEQAAGKHHELTPASDVYSLGALLYALLTGRPPFLAENIPATLRLVAEADPVAPRLLAPAVPRDLETICLKCLAKEPGRRYSTAQALAEDLNRFLSNEPIYARPAGVTEKIHRWCLRNKPLAIAGTALLGLLLVVAIGSPIAALRINRERARAEASAKQALSEAARSQQIAKFFKDMLKTVGPSVALGEDTKLLRRILDDTAARIGSDLTNQPLVETEIRETIEGVYSELGEYSKAEAMQKRVVGLRQKLYGTNHLEVARSLTRLSVVVGNLSRYEEAEKLVREALVIQTNLISTDHVDVAYSLNCLGVQLSGQHKDSEAQEVFKRALAIRERLFGHTNREVAVTLMNLAEYNPDPGDTEKMYRDVIAILETLYGKDHPELEVVLDNLANCFSAQKRYAEAEQTARRSLELKRKMFGPAHPHLARSLGILGWNLRFQNKFEEAEAVMREDYEIKKKSVGYSHSETAMALDGVIDILNSQKKFADLEALLRNEAISVRQSPDAASPSSSNLLAKMETAHIDVLGRLGRWNEAHAAIEKALAEKSNTNSLQFADGLNGLANQLREAKRYDDAAALGEQALKIQLRLAGTNLPLLIETYGGVAGTLDVASKYSNAAPLLEQRLELIRRLHGNESLKVSDALGWNAWVYMKDKRYPEEESALQKRLAIQEKHFGSEHTNLLETLERLAGNLETQGKLKEAEALSDQAMAICEKNFGKAHPETFGAGVTLTILCRRRAEILARNRQWDASMNALTRAIELKPDEHDSWHLLAPVLVETGQHEQYRQHCRDSLEKFSATDDPVIAERIAKDCLILPSSGANLETVSKMTDLAVSASSDHWAYPAFQFSKGFVEYRLGHFLAASEWMQKVLAAQGDWPRDVQAHLVLAMSDCQLGKRDEAQRALAQALSIQQSHEPKPESSDDLGPRWNDWLIVHALIRETHGLIEGDSSNPTDGLKTKL